MTHDRDETRDDAPHRLPARLPRRLHARGGRRGRSPGEGRRRAGRRRGPHDQPVHPGLHLQEGEGPPPPGLQPRPGDDAADPHRTQGRGPVPVRRRGTRRSTWWPAASREALDDDPATVVPYLYNSSAGEIGGGMLGPLLWDALGASKVDHTICAATTGRAWSLVFGGMTGADPLDVVHSQLVVVWGANPSISNTHFPPLVQRARSNGAALVVVDPRRTGMAKRADLHLAVRPGTDVVLAMAVARELEQRKAIDRGLHRRPRRRASTSTSRPARRGRSTCAAEECGLDHGRDRGLRRPARRSSPGVLAHRVGDGAQPQRRVGGAGRVRPARCSRARSARSAPVCTSTPTTTSTGTTPRCSTRSSVGPTSPARRPGASAAAG